MRDSIVPARAARVSSPGERIAPAGFLRDRTAGWLALAAPVTAALAPLALLVASNAGNHDFPWVWLLRPGLILLALASTLVVVAGTFLNSRTAGAGAATVFMLAWPLYAGVGPGVIRLGLSPLETSIGFVAVLLLASVAVARLLSRPYLIIAGLVLAITIAWDARLPAMRAFEGAFEGRSPDAIALAASAGSRDVVYIVVDAMARLDVLRERFGVDTAAFERSMAADDVFIASRARSNYAQTSLSLASSLNGAYLEEGSNGAGRTRDLYQPHEIMAQAALIKRFRARGYEFVMIASDTAITPGHPQAARCVCPLPSGPTELEYALLSAGPFGDMVGVDQWTLQSHWRYVTGQFDAIEAAQRDDDRPVLVVAHVLAPHPPFVFDEHGAFRPGQGRYSMRDGDGFPGTREEYREGYARQASYVLRRVAELVHRLRQRPRPPIIVIHGDHGSGLGLVDDGATGTDWNERLSILAAFAAPDGAAHPSADVTPVNALRWAYSAATGDALALLPNRSFASSYEAPFALVQVPASTRDGEN